MASLVEEMLHLDLLEEEEGLVWLTLLGRACGTSSLSFASSKRLIRMFKQGQLRGDTTLGLLTATHVTSELDDIYTPMQKRGTFETKWSVLATRNFGADVRRAPQRYAEDSWAFHARCKRSLVLRDWMNGKAMADLKNTYKTNAFIVMDAGSIRGSADATCFHLRSVHALASALLVTGDLDAEAFDREVTRLKFGLLKKALGLLELPLRLDRREMLALHARAGSTLEQLRGWSLTDLQSALGEDRGFQVHAVLYSPA
ncbi:hypothetical protein [Deinococcus humi]|uniref:Uncharacterized protein n=1 Tax=Deinococcus humi TaxID=662880 RepID=A0A7W8JZZ6_9DEIO|nr:hypothetical protein [Deinococcus humi]MBB5366274.1 hypothetical protein [Deinococcus humi]